MPMSVAYRKVERRIQRSVTFEPCLPRPAKQPPSGPDWLHEIKHDGLRIVAQKEADRVRLLTRNGTILPSAIHGSSMPSETSLRNRA